MKEIIIELEVSEKSKIIELPISDEGIIELDFTYLDDELETDEFEDQTKEFDLSIEDEAANDSDMDDLLEDDFDDNIDF